VGEVPHLFDRSSEILTQRRKPRGRRRRVRAHRREGELEARGEPDQLLLRAVMERALEATALVIGGEGQALS
jgi:hypothetical protein